MAATALNNTIPLSEAKNHFSMLALKSNETGMPFVITKNKRPWVEVRPLASKQQDEGSIIIVPTRRAIDVPDIDQLFEDYDGDYLPHEDGFASAIGKEAM